jgi:hypothetical protein
VAAHAPPPPPVVERPAAYEVSYGVVAGRAPTGTRRLVVRAGGIVLAERPLRGRRFHVVVDLPARDTVLTVVAVGSGGRRSSARVGPVFGLPRGAAPRLVAQRNDPGLARRLRRLAARFGGTAGIFVQSLTSGVGAAWNAKASFPGASALKLAVAVTALARTEGAHRPGSALDVLLRQMLVHSDNAAANGVERYFGGSTSGGSALVNELMRSLGLVDTDMYGGYETTRAPQGGIPVRVESQPGWGVGKRSTAWDLASLARAVWLASGGHGPLRRAQPGFTPAEARYLLFLLARVHDHGKLDREVGALPGVSVLHKAGWIGVARHDNGLVFWRGGVFVAAVMTYRSSGAGIAADALAGRVARVALDRFRG